MFTSPRTARRSHFWTALSLGAELLLKGMRWVVGDGWTIQIWQDHWLPNGSLRSYIKGPLLPQEEDCQLNSIWSTQTWDFEALNLPLSPQLQDLLQGIPVARFARLIDHFLWPHNKGTYSIKSASKFLFQHQ